MNDSPCRSIRIGISMGIIHPLPVRRKSGSSFIEVGIHGRLQLSKILPLPMYVDKGKKNIVVFHSRYEASLSPCIFSRKSKIEPVAPPIQHGAKITSVRVKQFHLFHSIKRGVLVFAPLHRLPCPRDA